MGLMSEKGWYGSFTRDRALGAVENGTRLRKVRTEPGDRHPLNTQATVLGSLSHAEVGLGYFVEWDDLPKHAVFVVAHKVAPL